MGTAARERLVNRRLSETFRFEPEGLRFTATVNRLDGPLAELFLNNHKAGNQTDTKAEVRGSNPVGRASIFKCFREYFRQTQIALSAECPRKQFSWRSGYANFVSSERVGASRCNKGRSGVRGDRKLCATKIICASGAAQAHLIFASRRRVPRWPSATSEYQDIVDGTFPAPVPLGPRAVGWLETEIMEWQERRIAERCKHAAALVSAIK
jgi:prophage regulatory protein